MTKNIYEINRFENLVELIEYLKEKYNNLVNLQEYLGIYERVAEEISKQANLIQPLNPFLSDLNLIFNDYINLLEDLYADMCLEELPMSNWLM